METILTQTDRLIISDELRKVMAKYVWFADQKNWNAFSSLFTETGTFTPLDTNGKAILEMSGRDNIRKTISESVGNATAIHHLFSYEVEIDSPKSAKGIFAMEDFVIREDNADAAESGDVVAAFKTLKGYGHYHADFINEDGKWLIQKLVQTRLKLDFTF